ncbi:hypothetical protein KC322_g129 [Hortaea werneckii]|nr:hypothetical protein KC322_g129 [Hortaea werneckii]
MVSTLRPAVIEPFSLSGSAAFAPSSRVAIPGASIQPSAAVVFRMQYVALLEQLLCRRQKLGNRRSIVDPIPPSSRKVQEGSKWRVHPGIFILSGSSNRPDMVEELTERLQRFGQATGHKLDRILSASAESPFVGSASGSDNGIWRLNMPASRPGTMRATTLHKARDSADLRASPSLAFSHFCSLRPPNRPLLVRPARWYGCHCANCPASRSRSLSALTRSLPFPSDCRLLRIRHASACVAPLSSRCCTQLVARCSRLAPLPPSQEPLPGIKAPALHHLQVNSQGLHLIHHRVTEFNGERTHVLLTIIF